jgi:NitT/TauT family transport system substrate-binding protein
MALVTPGLLRNNATTMSARTRRRTTMPRLHSLRRLLLGLLALAANAPQANAAQPVAFGLDWQAEAEYGGYYQALATGLYAKNGLDVTLRQGGPQVNQAQLLLAGRLDLMLSSNSFLALNFVKEDLPFEAVAAMFQKDPAVLLAHPGQGNDSFAALRGKPIMISADSHAGWWNFLRARFGYSDSQIRPYTFNLAPFLADPSAVEQGYLGSEPYSVRTQGGFTPVVLLLADAGYSGYASLVSTSTRLIQSNPDLIARFLAATQAGWTDYLHGDPTPGNDLIKRDNPEMTDALLAYGRQALIEHGIVESGDATALGIGAMTPARWQDFLQSVSQQGVYPADMDVRRAYTLQFVGKH